MCGGESGNRGRGRDDREARASVRRRGMTAGKGTESCRRASQKQPAGGGGGRRNTGTVLGEPERTLDIVTGEDKEK